MSFNSKYTGAKIEEFLDKINSGEVGTYVSNIDVITLLGVIDIHKHNPSGAPQIAINGDLLSAIENFNRITIPYSNSRADLGYYTITGFVSADSKLSFTLPINEGKVIYCNSCPVNLSNPSINAKFLDIIDLYNKQDKLISGVNISTINGQSLLEGEDLTIGQPVVNVLTSGILNKEATFNIQWGKIHIIPEDVSNVNITNRTLPTSDYVESSVIFRLSSLGDFNLFGNVPINWPNGINPLSTLEINVLYELSISATTIDGIIVYNGILVPFK